MLSLQYPLPPIPSHSLPSPPTPSHPPPPPSLLTLSLLSLFSFSLLSLFSFSLLSLLSHLSHLSLLSLSLLSHLSQENLDLFREELRDSQQALSDILGHPTSSSPPTSISVTPQMIDDDLPVLSSSKPTHVHTHTSTTITSSTRLTVEPPTHASPILSAGPPVPVSTLTPQQHRYLCTCLYDLACFFLPSSRLSLNNKAKEHSTPKAVTFPKKMSCLGWDSNP